MERLVTEWLEIEIDDQLHRGNKNNAAILQKLRDMATTHEQLLHACQMAGRCEEGWLNACYEACKQAGAPLA